MQKSSVLYLFSAFFLTFCSGDHCLGRDGTVSAESLFAHARKLEDVWSDGTPAMRVRMEIEVSKHGTALGEYVVTWISPSRWREDLEIAGYKRTRVHNSKGYWQQSTQSFQPELIFQLESMLDFKTVLRFGQKQIFGKVKTKDKDGVRQDCVEVRWVSQTERILCFDEPSGSLLSVGYPKADNQNAPDISRIEYTAYKNIGEKSVPYEVRAFRGRTTFISAKIVDITPISDNDEDLFVAPVNSEFWPQCEDVRNPELLTHVQPKYPMSARMNGEQGRIIFYAIIETDGTLSHLTLIQRATPTLESAAADAILQWRYKPAVCGSTPVRTETSLPVDFWLQH